MNKKMYVIHHIFIKSFSTRHITIQNIPEIWRVYIYIIILQSENKNSKNIKL